MINYLFFFDCLNYLLFNLRHRNSSVAGVISGRIIKKIDLSTPFHSSFPLLVLSQYWFADDGWPHFPSWRWYSSLAQPFELFRQVPWWETSSPWYPASCTGTRLFKVMRQIWGLKQPLQISLFYSLNVLRFRRALNFALCLCIHIFLRKLMIYSLIPLYLQASMNFIH